MITQTLVGINHDISEIKNDNYEINIKLDSISEKSIQSECPNYSKFNLPLTTQFQVDELEENIKDRASKDFQDLVNILAHVGGPTAKKNVQLMMKKLMNRELSLQYSAQGKKQKKNFSKLSLYKAVLEAVKINFKYATDLDITRTIGISLATAGDREGGRSIRELDVVYFDVGTKLPKIIVDDYDFNMARKSNLKTTWICPSYFRTKCKTRATTSGRVVYINGPRHNHAPKLAKNQLAAMMCEHLTVHRNYKSE